MQCATKWVDISIWSPRHAFDGSGKERRWRSSTKNVRRFRDKQKTFIGLSPSGRWAKRAVESVKQALRCFLVDLNLDKTSWPSVLQEVAFNVNSLISSSTKFTPQELMFGASIRSAIDQVVGDCQKTGDKERRSRDRENA